MPAASAKLEHLERDQLEARLMQLRDRKRLLERQLEEIRNAVGPLTVRGNELGITYEELAALTGLSRPRIAQLLAQYRAELEEPGA